MSVNVGDPGTPPMLFYSDAEQLTNHLIEMNGMDAVLGMAEIAAWCEAPARAIGRHDVRTPAKSLDEMFASATNETEREAIRTAMFGSVMDVIDRYLPDAERIAVLRGMLAFLSINSTYRGPYTPGSALCLAFAMATAGTRMISKMRGGIGTLCDHVRDLSLAAGGEVRLHCKVEEILTDGARVTGVRLTTGERSPRPSSSRTSIRPSRSPACSIPRSCPTTCVPVSTASTTRPRTSRSTSRSTVCRSSPATTRSSTRASCGRRSAVQAARTDAARLRGLPAW